MRLFRQAHPGDWEGVFARMAEVLRRRAAPPRPRGIVVDVAPGELIDKITILEIKSQRIADAGKLRNVRLELEALAAARDRAVPASDALAGLTADLKAANETLWDVEDAIRRCEREQDFGPRFVE